MNIPNPTLTQIVRSATGLAGLTGTYGFLHLMGAFGPVSCWTSVSSSQTATESGGISSSGTTVTRGCEAGIDYLLGGTGGNASVLFFWAVILLAFVIVGGAAAWTEHRYVTTIIVGVGLIISILGIWSIGWYFMLPTLFLLAAVIALSFKDRQNSDEIQTARI